MADTSSGNDVWGTIAGAIKVGADAYTNIETAKIKAAASAAPSGRVGSTIQNPGPGQFGAFPQAQTKVNNGNAGGFPSSISDTLSMGLGKSSNITLLLIAAFLVVVLAVLRR